MRILVVGGGGREHALIWKLAQSPHVPGRDDLLCVPGNPGIEEAATCLPAPAGGLADAEALAALAAERRADLTVVGPELPLTAGLVDELRRRGLAAFGPTREAARLEGSKVFAKEFMARHGVPTAPFEAFSAAADALAWLGRPSCRLPLVVKADGLAAGKGVVVARDLEEARAAVHAMMIERRFGGAGGRIVIEECLPGIEASFFALCDGERAVPLASCQDHKRLLDGDRGPNTGGMGAVSPAAEIDARLQERIMQEIIHPTVTGMAAEGRPYHGILYAGLMLCEDPRGGIAPRVLEFNARFGDPEAQVLLPRLAEDLVPLLAASAEGRLGPARREPSWRREWAACVVAASRGYPETSEQGLPIEGLEEAAEVPGTVVFQAGTRWGDGGRGPRVVTAGGRVLSVVALGADLEEALALAYRAMSRIAFDGMHFRGDIGRAAVARVAARGGRMEGRP